MLPDGAAHHALRVLRNRNGRYTPADLVLMAPGVTPVGGNTGDQGGSAWRPRGQKEVSVNGSRNNNLRYTLDGGTNMDDLVNDNLDFPFPDAVQEFSAQTSNMGVEQGGLSGGALNVITKSGTNNLKGSAFLYYNNDSLNANTYFNNARGGSEKGLPRPLYRFNYYGWDLGGPVPFVGTKEDPKLFFFLAQEYYDQLVPQAASLNIRVPTEAERGGDFSRSVDGAGRPIVIVDPTTGQPFPGNIIPAGRVYAPGRSILNLFPTPNTTAGGNLYNYTSQEPSKYPRREDIVRLDWQMASRTRLSARFVYNKDDQQFAYGTTTASWNWPLTVTDRKNGPGKTLSFTLTHIFNPSLTNEFIYGAGRGGVLIAPADDRATRAATSINTPLLFPEANTGNLIPSLTFGGIGSITTNATNPAAGGTVGTSVFGPFDQKFVINNFIDNVTKVSGRHTLKAGIYYQRASNRSNSQTNVEANIDFTSSASNPLSSAMAPAANRRTDPSPPPACGGTSAMARSARSSTTAARTGASRPAVSPRSASASSQMSAGGSRRRAPSSAPPLPSRCGMRRTVAPAASATAAVPSSEPSSTTITSDTSGSDASERTVAPTRSPSSGAGTSATTRSGLTRADPAAAATPGRRARRRRPAP
jgi:hypothetical protein